MHIDDDISGYFALQSPLSLGWLIFSAVLGLIVTCTVQWTRAPNFPTINAYPADFTLKRAHREYLNNARGLIADGFAKFGGPFRLITTFGSRIILPASYTEWVKKCPDLDHQAFVTAEYLTAFPGFEGNATVTDPRRILIDVITKKLSHNARAPQIMHEHMAELIEARWTNEQDWHSIEWSQDSMAFVARQSASIFAGSKLARDPEWQRITIASAINLFLGVRALRAFPAFLRPFAVWFLPECRKCRDELQLARSKISEILVSREREKEIALAEGRTPEKYEDTLTWMEEVAVGRPYDAAAAQIGFAIAAIHTTSQLLNQTVLDLCMHPELIKPLRDEIDRAISESGWTIAGLFKMQLLDSVIKETQRLKPGALVNLERRALCSVVMPNGIKLPRGSHISVDTSEMWNPETYPNPERYDGFRFQRMRQVGGKDTSSAQLVSTSPEHIAFGMGKAICPGRFFVANELKVALANILMKYDMRLQDGYVPQTVNIGFEMLADPAPKIEVRHRAEFFNNSS